MTPENLTQEQTKLLEIHEKKNHCVTIKEIQVMAKWVFLIPNFHSANHQFARRACLDAHTRNTGG